MSTVVLVGENNNALTLDNPWLVRMVDGEVTALMAHMDWGVYQHAQIIMTVDEARDLAEKILKAIGEQQ